MAKKKTLSQVLEEFRAVHGDRYDYSLVSYKNAHTPVQIVCQKHGVFDQTPHAHRRGCGCPKCGTDRAAKATRGKARMSSQTARAILRDVFGDRYGLERVRYRGHDKPVELVCPEHGPFEIIWTNARKGHGCARCGYNNRQRGLYSARAVPLEEFLRRVHRKLRPNLIIDISSYSGIKQPISVYCPEHGWYTTVAGQLVGRRDCSLCAAVERGRRRKGVALATTEDFIRRARMVHGDKYDYSVSEWRLATEPIAIRCREHGIFHQLPGNHLSGSGCPRCARVISKGEQSMLEAFTHLGAQRGNRRLLGGLEIDIWIPEYKVGLEYHGSIWHSTYKLRDRYRHARKADIADEAGIRLLQIFDDEWDNPTKRRIIEDIAYRACGKTETSIGARKCELVHLSGRELRPFF